MTTALTHMDAGKSGSSVWWSGELTVPRHELDEALRHGWHRDAVDGWLVGIPEHRGDLSVVKLSAKPNLVTNTGIDRREQILFGIGGPPGALTAIGVDNGTVNPTASTAQSADGNSTSRTILAFDSTPTYARPVVTAVRTFTNSNVAFIMKRLFQNATTTDASGNLHSMTNVFTLDLVTGSPFSSWSQVFSAATTGTGS